MRWIKLITIIYLLIGIAFYFLQDYVLFHPVSLKKDHKYNFKEPHKDINIAVNDESNLNIIQFLAAGTACRGVILYFHGNKKNISWYSKYTPYFTKQGYEVWMIDYPGFGKSTGKFSEKTLYEWAGHLYRFANTRFSADRIIIYGKSMGTGIAAQLASKQPCKRLILETPYYDFPSVVNRYMPVYPVYSMLHYEMPTHRFIQRVRAPVTIFQGTKDCVITHRNASRLKKFLKQGDEFVTIKGGSHNNLFSYKETTQKLDSLLNIY